MCGEGAGTAIPIGEGLGVRVAGVRRRKQFGPWTRGDSSISHAEHKKLVEVGSSGAGRLFARRPDVLSQHHVTFDLTRHAPLSRIPLRCSCQTRTTL